MAVIHTKLENHEVLIVSSYLDISHSPESNNNAAFLCVGDTTLFDAVLLENEVMHITTAATLLVYFNGLDIEAAFHGLATGAEDLGMKINKK